jgi:hypothetical protein
MEHETGVPILTGLDGPKFPEIGEVVSTEWALDLCKHFGLDYLVERISANLNKYRAWKFDGVSCMPDELLGFFFKLDWKDITYLCALPHDLAYAYGEKGNEEERKQADVKLYNDLIDIGMKEWCAKAFLEAVRIGGAEAFGTSFTWGFAFKGVE